MAACMLLGCLYSKVLVHPWQLLYASVEEHEVVHQLDQPVLPTHLQEVLVQLVAAVVLFVLLPPEEIFLLCADGAVFQPVRVIACKYELHCGKEPLVELGLLIGKELTDAVADRDGAAFQLQHPDGYAVDIEHNVRPPLLVAFEGHLFGEGEVVFLRLLPVDEADCLRDLARLDLHRDAVAH